MTKSKKNYFTRFYKQIISVFVILFVLATSLPANLVEAASNPNISNTNADYLAPVTFYDYYGKYQTADTTDNADNDHYSFERYNKVISDYAKNNSIKYPVYFGDFNGAAGSSNHPEWNPMQGQPLLGAAYNFYWAINRANRNAGYTASLQGIVSSSLDSDNDLTQDKTDGTAVKAPYFSSTVNSGTAGETVTGLKFPFKKRVLKNANYYTFSSGKSGYNKADSTPITDVVRINKATNHLDYWFDVSNTDPNTVMDMNGVAGWGGGANAPGFFPFNQPGDDSNVSKLNYGFGTRVDVPFNLTNSGTTTDLLGNTIPMQFNFKGDDDVWVYIDGKLVLDMGGGHSQANGSINFQDRTQQVAEIVTGADTNTILTSNNLYQSVDQNNPPKQFTLPSSSYVNGDSSKGYDITKTHKLTVFYMERGMIESNLFMSFNFIPTPNQFIVEKQVDSTGVNSAVQSQASTIANGQDFNFNISNNGSAQSGLDYQYTTSGVTNTKTMSGTGFNLKNGEKADFYGAFNLNDNVTVNEASNDNYTASWVTKDLTNATDTQLASGTGNTIDPVTIATTQTPYDYMTHYAKLTNKINTGTLSIGKQLIGVNNQTDTFKFKVTLNSLLGTNITPLNYSGEYFVNSVSKNTTLENGDNVISLKAGETAQITGLPYGTNYDVEEIPTSGYTLTQTSSNGTTNPTVNAVVSGSITSANKDQSVVYTNTKDVQYGTLTITKVDKLDQSVKLQNAEFKIEKLDSGNNVDPGFTALTATTDANGQIKFSNLPYGNYVITETKAPDGYELLKSQVNVTIDGTNGGNISTTISDAPKTILPNAGGIGTMIFTIIGLILIALAITGYGILSYKRRKSYENKK